MTNKQHNYSDKELLFLVKHNQKSRTKALKALYKQHQSLVRVSEKLLVKAMSYTEAREEALSVYHTALVIFVEKVVDKKLEIQSSIGGYLRGVVINLSKQKIQNTVKHDHTSMTNHTSLNDLKYSYTIDQSDEKDWKHCVEKAMSLLKPKHQQILRLRMMSHSFKEIAKKLGYSDDTTVRVTYRRSLQKLTSIIKDNADLRKRVDELMQKTI